MPKPSFAAWLPAMDWKTRSVGAPCSISRTALVTWQSTQVWVGMA